MCPWIEKKECTPKAGEIWEYRNGNRHLLLSYFTSEEPETVSVFKSFIINHKTESYAIFTHMKDWNYIGYLKDMIEK